MKASQTVRRLRDRRADDQGFSLIEVLVSMGIFSIVLSIMVAGVMQWTQATAKNIKVSDQTTTARNTFNRLDKTVPAASAINYPTQVGGTRWYVELQVKATNPATCTQWKLDGASNVLSTRTWDTLTTKVAPPTWTVIARDVVNDEIAGSPAPFVLQNPNANSGKQMLRIALHLRAGTDPVSLTNGTFVARNTSTMTETLPVASGGQGSTVCSTDFTTAGAFRP